MTFNAKASKIISTQKSAFIWPEDLDTIKISKEERNLLETKIESLRDLLPPNMANIDSFKLHLGMLHLVQGWF